MHSYLAPTGTSALTPVRLQRAQGFLVQLGAHLGFPSTTLATAQSLFHLYTALHPPISYHHLAIASLLLSNKLNDTLKKLVEIVNTANTLIEQLTPEQPKLVLEHVKPQLIAIERLLLQSISFNFNLFVPAVDLYSCIIRLGRSMGASKSFCFLAHLIGIDSQRTGVALSYPTHTIACASLYLGAFLEGKHPLSREWRTGEETALDKEVAVELPPFEPGWAERYESDMGDIEEISHVILNLFIQLCPVPPSSSSNQYPSTAFPSPLSPSSNSPSSNPPLSGSSSSAGTIQAREKALKLSGVPITISGISVYVVARRQEEFMRIKVFLRKLSSERVEQERKTGGARGQDMGKRTRGVAEESNPSKRWRSSVKTGGETTSKSGTNGQSVALPSSVRYEF